MKKVEGTTLDTPTFTYEGYPKDKKNYKEWKTYLKK